MKKLLFLLLLSPLLTSKEEELFTVDGWEYSYGYLFVHLTIKEPRVKVSCRGFDKNEKILTSGVWSYDESGWETAIMMTTDTSVKVTKIKCIGKTL